MNAHQEFNDFTGESQDRCPICKRWGWPEEIAHFHPDEAASVTIEICSNCDEEHRFTCECPMEGNTVNPVLPPEHWARLVALANADPS